MAQVRLEANVVFSSYVAFTSNATYVAIRLWGVVGWILNPSGLWFRVWVFSHFLVLCWVSGVLWVSLPGVHSLNHLMLCSALLSDSQTHYAALAL